MKHKYILNDYLRVLKEINDFAVENTENRNGELSDLEDTDSEISGDFTDFLNRYDFDELKVIWSVILIGKEYKSPEYTDEEYEKEWLKSQELPGYVIPDKKIFISNPNTELNCFMDKLEIGSEFISKKNIITKLNNDMSLFMIKKYLDKGLGILEIKSA